MKESELIRKYMDIIEYNSIDNEEDLDKNMTAQGPKKFPPIKNPNDEETGKFVAGNKHIGYMQPIGKTGQNISLGVGKPMLNRDTSAILTIGGNPSNKNDFLGVQINQPLGKDEAGQRKGPGIAAVYQKKF